jgi:peroxin-1
MNLASDVSLREVAQQTEGYSGADLQALLYNAYLSAIHEVVDLEEQDMGSETNAANHAHYDLIKVDTTKAGSDAAVIANGKVSANDRATISKKLERIMSSQTSVDPTTTDSEPNKNSGASADDVIVTSKHVAKSLAETQPSISLKERLKLEAIYHQFVTGRSGEMPPGTASNEIGARATLS